LECYGIVVKARAKKCMECHTYKLKEEGSYKLVLMCTSSSTLKKSKPKLRNWSQILEY
jgi:hypothetical protein